MTKDYGDSVNSNLNAAKICFIISIIIGALGTLYLLITVICLAAYELYFLGFFGLIFAFLISIIFWIINPFIGISLSSVSKNEQPESTDINDRQNLIRYILFNFITGVLGIILLTIFFILQNYNGIYIASVMSGTLNLPNLIGLIFLIIIYNKIKNVQPASISVKQSTSQINGSLNDRIGISENEDLIAKVGKKFFIKYFYQLRDWSTLDILDEITEDYSESSKTERIKNAKAIFSSNLDYMILLDIFNPSKSSVDEQTRNNAKLILQKEYKTEIGEILS